VGLAGGTVLNTPEAGRNNKRPSDFYLGNWTSPLSSRILFDVAAARSYQRTTPIDFVASLAPRITEASTGMSYRSWAGANSGFTEDMANTFVKASTSYVTGSHAAKIGLMYENVLTNQVFYNFMDISYATLNYRPTSVTYYSSPYPNVSGMHQLGLYAQDQWTHKRATLNVGLRYDDYVQDYPDIHLPATTYIPVARDFPGDTLVHWRDLSPRLGLAYDLRGDAKTAIRFSINRYLLRSNLILNPARQNTSVTRQWTDPNGDYIIQGDPLNPAANGELGASNNLAFGQPKVAQTFDPDYAFGFGTRRFNWETSLGLQQELLPRVGLNVAYYRRWYGNFEVTDNTLVGPQDYTSFCVTTPTDPRLPQGGGYQICGLEDVNPDKRGQNNAIVTTSSGFGKQIEHWNGVDATIDARFASARLQGGVSTGKTTTDNCELLKNLPEAGALTIPYCHAETPFLTQIKLGGSYTLPYEVQLSGTVQSFRSNAISATGTFTTAQIQPSLGRPLTSGATAAIQLITPGTMYNPRFTQLDLRFAKTIPLHGIRVKGMLDVYNALNSNTVLDVNSAYGTNGSSWLVPTQIALARFFKVGVQIDF
jgi:hypothetical protein